MYWTTSSRQSYCHANLENALRKIWIVSVTSIMYIRTGKNTVDTYSALNLIKIKKKKK